MQDKIKLGIITSKGGHLLGLIQIQKLFKKYTRFWVTFQGKDTSYYLRNENTYYAFYPESRNILNALKNLILSFIIFSKEKPTILISCGAGIAVPFFIVGKLFYKTKLIFIEPYDFVVYPSLSGRIIYPFCDLFLVQHEIQKKWYPKAKYWGSIL